MKIKFGLLFILLNFFQYAGSQHNPTSILNQEITIDVKNEAVSVILKKIEKQIPLAFSYDSKSIDTKKKRSASFKNKPLSEAVSILFDNKVKCKVKGNYIILYKDTSSPPAVSKTASRIENKKNSKISKDTAVRYFIDMIVPGFSGKDSVVSTDSVEFLVPKHVLINNDTTILLMRKSTVVTPEKP